ncbi:MAG: cation-transporting P-type ATPase, partial [Candidatus Nitrotoga sp.]|nr:cation-transporting P-type ATPase [Candidatus Nitrotoga sp.]
MHSNDNNWHTLTTDEVAQRLETNPQSGLSSTDAAKRLAQYGANELKEKRARSPWRMLLDQFAYFMIIVLIGAAVVSGIVGDVEDTVAIIVIVILNAVI